jgi:lactate dehydrogenase-like 2-hydroxyacid dehydrogenase
VSALADFVLHRPSVELLSSPIPVTAPNAVLLPHVGFENVEAMSVKADIALCHLENFLHGRGLALHF